MTPMSLLLLFRRVDREFEPPAWSVATQTIAVENSRRSPSEPRPTSFVSSCLLLRERPGL